MAANFKHGGRLRFPSFFIRTGNPLSFAISSERLHVRGPNFAVSFCWLPFNSIFHRWKSISYMNWWCPNKKSFKRHEANKSQTSEEIVGRPWFGTWILNSCTTLVSTFILEEDKTLLFALLLESLGYDGWMFHPAIHLVSPKVRFWGCSGPSLPFKGNSELPNTMIFAEDFPSRESF